MKLVGLSLLMVCLVRVASWNLVIFGALSGFLVWLFVSDFVLFGFSVWVLLCFDLDFDDLVDVYQKSGVLWYFSFRLVIVI